MRPRSPVYGLMIVLVTVGCTHIALQRRTVQQASTISDLQYHQVLDNLAMFACNSEAIAWHLKLQGGVVQVTDQGSGQVAAQVISGLQLGPTVTPLLSGQRSVVTQWSGSPAVDSDDLELLSLAYQRVTAIEDKDVQRTIRQKIWEQSTTYNFFPPSDVLLEIMKDAVDTKFDDHDKAVKAAGEGMPLLDAVRQSLKDARKALIELIEMQRIGARNKVTYRANDPDHLKKVEEVINHLLAAEALIREAEKTLPETAKEKLAQFKREIHNITDVNGATNEETLNYLTLHLNPLISKHIIETDRANRPAGMVNRDGPQSEGALKGLQPNIYFMGVLRADRYYVAQAVAVRDPNLPNQIEKRNPGLVDQAQTKVDALISLLQDDEYQVKWFGVGCKKDVPACACYVGHGRSCGCERYVWVTRENLKSLKKFTLALSSLDPDDRQDSFTGRGPAFSPGTR